MKPGDYIEWIYTSNRQVVICDEALWSSVMNCYASIGGDKLHLLISNADGILTWMNNEGLFRARAEDARAWIRLIFEVVPQVRLR